MIGSGRKFSSLEFDAGYKQHDPNSREKSDKSTLVSIITPMINTGIESATSNSNRYYQDEGEVVLENKNN